MFSVWSENKKEKEFFMSRWNRCICENCRVVFVKEKEDQKFCSYLCEKRHEGEGIPGQSLAKYECQNCGRIFNNYNPRRWCSDFCRKQMNKPGKVSEDHKSKVQNRLWIENRQIHHQVQKNKHRLSYEEMERRAEIKRVFGKGAWDHYEKGRKWDRI